MSAAAGARSRWSCAGATQDSGSPSSTCRSSATSRRTRIAAASLADRTPFVAGDFFADRLPEGHDTVLLSNILHGWSEADARRILALCTDVLPADGTLIICESFVGNDKRGPAPAALMSLNMLVETWGRNYTAAEYTSWLREVGLRTERVLPLDGAPTTAALVARKVRP
ncbi:methyltransferase [Streptomyces celluloflavus]|uniref:Methyltransferase n=1 Tax=Streptomyces celluloflavus TaxID=58344 RepID=A0ABW7RHM0_9ACTN|nr:methyltransferase [Streptomyces celluloflavus]